MIDTSDMYESSKSENKKHSKDMGEDDKDIKSEWDDSDSEFFREDYPKGKSKERPKGIKILTVFFVINGIFSLGLILLLALDSGLSLDLTLFQGLIVGITAFPIAYGLWKGLSWARISAIIIVLLALVMTIINAFVFDEGGSTISFFVNILILLYLFKGEVKDYFK